MPDRTLCLRRPAHPAELTRIRGQVQRWAQRHHIPEHAVIDLVLALGEAVANGVEHAYRGMASGTVDVEVELHQPRRRAPGRTVTELRERGGRIVVRVSDHGRWRPPPAVNGYRGRGMLVIERLSRWVRVDRTGSGTRVCFEIAF